MEEQRTRVGVGIMIVKENKVLLGKRKNAHGEGSYAFPGGHLEYMESFEECTMRELEEECGMKIKNLRFGYVANVKHFDPKHYIHVTVVAKWESGDPEVREPEKCEGWEWYALDALPAPLFPQTEVSILSYKEGTTYYDSNDFEKALSK